MVVEFSDAGFAFEVGEEAFFVVVAQGGDWEMEHFGYLADGVHGVSSFWFLFLFYDKWGEFARIGRRGVCIGSGWGFVGGWLLRCRKSAKSVFQKSELASFSRSNSELLKNNADSRHLRISSPPAESARTDAHSTAGYSEWEVRVAAREGMGHQRCAGCLGGKAEFPCGLTGEVVHRCCAGCLG